jgi:hypothetical protein
MAMKNNPKKCRGERRKYCITNDIQKKSKKKI